MNRYNSTTTKRAFKERDEMLLRGDDDFTFEKKDSPTMLKFRSHQCASREAEIRNKFWGFCVLDGFYYVGTEEELKSIGVFIQYEVAL